VSKSQPKSFDADDQAPQTNQGPPPEGVEVEYGSITWAPICPYCKRAELPPEKRQHVRCLQTRTEQAIAYYKCPTEGCEFSIALARPWRPKHWGMIPQQINVAARPEMK
jgi:hypothetical protein